MPHMGARKVLSYTGSMTDTIREYNSLRYRGYYYDSDTGLYYLNSRYYDPVMCRFVNADKYVFSDDIQGSNSYSYCGYDPINRIDPLGYGWWDDFCAWYSEIWDATMEMYSYGFNKIGELFGAAVGSLEAEAGIGYGLKGGVAENGAEVQLGGKFDVVNVKVDNSGVRVGQEDEIVARASFIIWEVGPHEVNFFDAKTETYNKHYALEEEKESISIIGIDAYVIIGFNVSVDFNFVKFYNSAIEIFNE